MNISYVPEKSDRSFYESRKIYNESKSPIPSPPENSGKKLAAIICAGLLLFGVLYTTITTISKNNKKDANIHTVSSGSTI